MPPAVLTQHNDARRSGMNSDETELDWETVSVNTFGRLCTHPVNGLIYAQPLFVPTVQISDRGTHDVVIVATMENWIYAIDAADRFGAPSAQLWAHHLGDIEPVPTRAFRQGYADIAGAAKRSNIGILSTPVIDATFRSQHEPTTGTIYVVAMGWDASKFAGQPETAFSHYLFALDLSTGLPRILPGGNPNPVRFEAEVAGSGYGAPNRVGPARRVDDRILFDGKVGNAALDGSRDLAITDGRIEGANERVAFNSMQQLQRPGLLLADGVIYTAFGSHGDHDPYHGWIFAHDARTLAPRGVFCTTRNGAQGGVWQAGEGLGADAAGNVYAGTGNGDFGAAEGAFGECLLKLRLGQRGLELDGFNQAFRDPHGGDEDFGASSPTVLPDGLMVGGGKDGHFYLFDPQSMDASGNPAALLQLFLASADRHSDPGKTRHIHGSPVVRQGAQGTFVYVWGENDVLRCFRYDPVAHNFPGQPNGRDQPGMPAATGSTAASVDVPVPGGMPGAMLSLSANGSNSGSAIIWASFPPFDNANQAVVQGELRAFKADEFENGRLVSLWSSRCNRARDDFGAFAKFCCPTIAAGRVFQATFNEPGGLAVYGKLSQPGGGYDIGFGGKTGLVFNGSASIEHGQVCLVSAPHLFQASSIFNLEKVDVRTFMTTFVIQMPQSDADGFAFVIQGASLHALGGSGMGLGYGPDAVSAFDRGAKIEKSVAIKFGLIDTATLQPRSTIGLYADGATPNGGPNERDMAISLHTGKPVRITIEYTNGSLKVTTVEVATKRQDHAEFQVDVPGHSGTQAYVGFTGASGGKTSTQLILAWDFRTFVA